MVAFDISGGASNWSYSSAQLVKVVASELDGGVAIKASQANGSQTLVRVSAAGAGTPAGWSGRGLVSLGGQLWSDVTATEAVRARAAEALSGSSTGWSAPDQEGANAEAKIYVDNSAGTQPVLVKLEGDNSNVADNFHIVPPHTTFRRAVDGVKPPGWTSPSGLDWFKVPDNFWVTIDGSGNATKDASWAAWTLAFAAFRLPDCNYDDTAFPLGCRTIPRRYSLQSGRKRDPEWSCVLHRDWLYPGPGGVVCPP